MFRIASAVRSTVQLSCRAVGGIQVSSFATATVFGDCYSLLIENKEKTTT